MNPTKLTDTFLWFAQRSTYHRIAVRRGAAQCAGRPLHSRAGALDHVGRHTSENRIGSIQCALAHNWLFSGAPIPLFAAARGQKFKLVVDAVLAKDIGRSEIAGTV